LPEIYDKKKFLKKRPNEQFNSKVKEADHYNCKKVKKASGGLEFGKEWATYKPEDINLKDIVDSDEQKSYKTEETKENVFSDNLFENFPLCPKDYPSNSVQLTNIFEEFGKDKENASLKIISDDLFLNPAHTSDDELCFSF
jgi:hypothetical protein